MEDINMPTKWKDKARSGEKTKAAKVNNKLFECFDIPEDLKYFRSKWRERIENVTSESKEKIMRAVEKIQVKLYDFDGWMLREFKLWDKRYKILDVNFYRHSDPYTTWWEGYENICSYVYGVHISWMMWDDVDWWGNQELKEYVKMLQWEWLHIPSIEEMKKLLWDLWKEAGLYEESDQIAMLMYLTGMDADYWLTMGDYESSGSQNSRSLLLCGTHLRTFSHRNGFNPYAGLCMMSVE